MKPGEKGVGFVPINKMKPRGFFTNVENGQKIQSGKSITLQGFAFGGGSALKSVMVSVDGGKTWRSAGLGKDYGAYGFRPWRCRQRGSATAGIQAEIGDRSVPWRLFPGDGRGDAEPELRHLPFRRLRRSPADTCAGHLDRRGHQDEKGTRRTLWLGGDFQSRRCLGRASKGEEITLSNPRIFLMLG